MEQYFFFFFFWLFQGSRTKPIRLLVRLIPTSGVRWRHRRILSSLTSPLFQACFLGTPSLFGFLVSGEAPRLPDLAK